MLHELQRRGYERFRVAPGMSPSGLHWRFSVTPVTNIRRSHGALPCDFSGPQGFYSTGQTAPCFGWTDAAEDSPEVLAAKFLDRFPELCRSGHGPDRDYALWYAEMLRATEPAGLIYAYADWDLPEDRLPTFGNSQEEWIPMPPPGEGVVPDLV